MQNKDYAQLGETMEDKILMHCPYCGDVVPIKDHVHIGSDSCILEHCNARIYVTFRKSLRLRGKQWKNQ